MSSAEQQDIRISELLRLLCDDRLSDDEAVELAALVAESDLARRRYVERVQLCVGLADWSQPAGIPSISRTTSGLMVNGRHARKKGARAAQSTEVSRTRPHSNRRNGHSKRSQWW